MFGRKVKTSIGGLIGVAVIATAALAIALNSADAAPTPKVVIGMDAVPSELQAKALSYASSAECEPDARFQQVVGAAASDGDGLSELEPNVSAIIGNATYAQLGESGKGTAGIPFLQSGSSPVYAVFLSGSCKGESRTFTQARVLLNETGQVMEVLVFAEGHEQSPDEPFGPQYDQAVTAPVQGGDS